MCQRGTRFDNPVLQQLWSRGAPGRSALRQSYERTLQWKHQHYVSAVAVGELIGYCSTRVRQSVWTEGPLADMDKLVVEASLRRAGIGGALFREAESHAVSDGCSVIELDYSPKRTATYNIYEHCGFENRGLVFSKPLQLSAAE